MSELAIKGGKPVRTAPWPTYPVYGDEEIAAATRVIRSGQLAAHQAPWEGEVERFEKAFAAYNGIAHVVATSCGTTALHTALAAMGVGVGDEVIVPPYTFLSTATSVVMQMGVPVFADIEPHTLGLDPQCVRRAVSPRTKAIIPVHMNGYPCDMDDLMAVAEEHKLLVIEDCSHAHGAMYKGRKVGTVGHIGAFSFQQKKNLSLGEGGCLITSDETLAETARAIRSFGKVPMAYNYRMTELHAAIGQVRLGHLDELNSQRIRNAAYLDAHLSQLRGLKPLEVREGTQAVYYNYVLQYAEQKSGVPRKDFVAAVVAEGIPLPSIYYPLYRDAAFQTRNAYGRGAPFTPPFYEAPEAERPRYEEGACPVCEEVCDKRNIELKIHPPADQADMADVVEAFRKVIDHVDELR